nr:O-antigen ligase family protein [Ktedonobacteraceae bacterium]
IALQLQHATNPIEIPLRLGAWQTAIQVIQAFPLTGVGLGYQAYILRAEPYRVPTQFVPLAHPHNSYLELGAMGGLLLLCVFMALLFFALRQTWRHWLLLDTRGRSLLAGGIGAIIALSINSLSVNVWTLPPLAAMGWLILGVISSPLLTARRKDQGSALTCQLTKEEEA